MTHESLNHAYRRDGFVVVPDLLSPQTLTELHGIIAGLVAASAAVTSFALWVSYDDGASWQFVRTDRASGGRYRAELRHPRHADSVSLRVRATDSGGSRIKQTIIRAYGLD